MKSKLSNAVIFALAIIGGLFIILMIVGAIMYNEEAKNSYEPVDFTPSDRLSGVEVQAFMNSCVGEGGDAAYCRCTLDHLQENSTPAEIRAMGENTTADYLPPEMWDAVYACSHLITEL